MNCLECGQVVPVRITHCGGPQPQLCSSDCKRRRSRKTTKRWIEIHRDQKLASDAKCRADRKQTHPDYFREHYAKNRERRKHESLAWYRANVEYAGQRQRAYVAAHPEQTRAHGRRAANTRRAIKKRVFVEVVDARTVFERDKGQCGICMKPVDPTSPWEVDHIVPISKGGPHSYANVQLSHRQCNRSKAARLVASR